MTDAVAMRRPLPFDCGPNADGPDLPDLHEGDRVRLRVGGSVGTVRYGRDLGTPGNPIRQVLVELDSGGRVWVPPTAVERLVEPAPKLRVVSRGPFLRLVASEGECV